MNDKKSILLVDDNKNDLLLMHAALKSAGFTNRIVDVFDGDEAIDYLSGDGMFARRNDVPIPGLILLDLNMPKKNGFEVLRWIRSQPEIKRLPIIVLTTSTLLGDIDLAYYLGANAFLIKPSDLAQLVLDLKCLKGWLQINHYPSLQGWKGEPAHMDDEPAVFQLGTVENRF